MATMYPAKVNSPITTLTAGINSTQTTIAVADSSVLPSAPNLLVLGTGEDAETCRYTNIVGNDVTVERGFQGIAKSWDLGTPLARNFTAYDYEALKTNLEKIPAGDNGDVQFNNNGEIGGSEGLNWDGIDLTSQFRSQEYRAPDASAFGLGTAFANNNLLPFMMQAYSDAFFFQEVFRVERWDVPTGTWIDESATELGEAQKVTDGYPATFFAVNNTWQKVRISIRVPSFMQNGLLFLGFFSGGNSHIVPSFQASVEFSANDAFDPVGATLSVPKVVSPSNFEVLGTLAIPNASNLLKLSGGNTGNTARARVTLDFMLPENEGNEDWGNKLVAIAQMAMYVSRLAQGTYRGLPFTWDFNTINTLTNFHVAGALSKESGSFKIDHPLVEHKELVHSFMESPQADLVYSGMVNLVNGTASVNIDTDSGMTEGTFVSFTRNHRRFCSNQTSFCRVVSMLEGNILTITCEDPNSDAQVFWQVIAERCDSHMLTTNWTDANGKVRVEPVKEDWRFDEESQTWVQDTPPEDILE